MITQKGERMNNLKPCPFCGNTDLKISVELTPDSYDYWHPDYPHMIKTDTMRIVTVSCKCGCSFETEDVGNRKWFEAWNRRVGDEISN